MGGLSRRTLLRVAPATAAALGLTVRARAADPVVAIDNFAFAPQALTVARGTVVTWTNHDDIPHQVVCIPVKLKSKVLDTDQSASFRFAEPGTFPYFCGLHPHMQGTVVVAG